MSSKGIIVASLDKLGHRARDLVTGREGVITSVCFDLYGCVQILLHPGLNDKGESREQQWYDEKRMELLSEKRVLEPPAYAQMLAAAVIGAAEKPLPR
jgi:hypothetical protein